jgi:hydroxypyruvate reductase
MKLWGASVTPFARRLIRLKRVKILRVRVYNMRETANKIINGVINDIKPDRMVLESLNNYNEEHIYLLAIGKAAWDMADAAYGKLKSHIKKGIVITKYGHSKGPIGDFDIFEAGHPVLDENSIKATEFAINTFKNLTEKDNVLFLISGGGSALFESPADGISLSDMEDITKQLLYSGADIEKINTIRKKLSKVKGGKFAQICAPANIYSVILSDVLGDNPEFIASGPAWPDSSTAQKIERIVNVFNLNLKDNVAEMLKKPSLVKIDNVKTRIIGSVKVLCETTANHCAAHGYKPYILTDSMACEAAQAGSLIGSIAKSAYENNTFEKPCALIFGGETVVKVKGCGLGGRNQEIALSAAKKIKGLDNVLIFSFGSDGTDGPTDAAGGIVTGSSWEKCMGMGIDPLKALTDNNAYHALKKSGNLLVTGPTGTNINDVTVALVGKCEAI